MSTSSMRRRRHRRLIPCVLAWSLALPAIAAEAPAPVTLDQALQAALARHPSLKAAGLSVEIAEQDRVAAGAMRLPQLDFSGGYLKSSANGQSLDFISNNAPDEYRAQLGFVQPLYTGGALGAALDRSEAAVEAARLDALATANQLRWQVVSQYIALLKAQQALAISRIRLATAEAHVREGEVLLKHGAAAELDAKRNALDLANARLDVERTQGDVAVARSLLATTTGLDVAGTAAPMPALQAPAGDLPSLVAAAQAQRAEWRGAQARLAMARADHRSAQAAFQPQLNLVGNAGWDTGQLFGLQNHGWSTGVNLGLPVFNWGRLSAQAQAAELTARRADQEAAQVALTIRAEVSEAWANLQVARRQLTIADQGVQLATDAAAMAQQGFRLGGVSNLEYLLTQQALATSRRQQADARLGLALATERLKWTLGETLP